MRFFSDGPSLPSYLLEQRSQGNVVFFCGAGISKPAGLPDFKQLTSDIIKILGSDKAQTAFEQGEGFDRLFNILVREYGRQQIDRQIYAALRTPRGVDVQNHSAVLDLSRGPDGHPQIVTTNFDLLFKRADKSVREVVPPTLPDITLNEPIDGITYLHGRLVAPSASKTAGYVITSSDFGRAYLADGWAARFVKALRERYTIVLLGYSAEDPPIKYLLEGLNAREAVTYESPIYAFTSANEDEAEELWIDRGVTPICYNAENGHN